MNEIKQDMCEYHENGKCLYYEIEYQDPEEEAECQYSTCPKNGKSYIVV